ncbi:MAG: WG repeat-containing protein, partial [Bacteroidota bacterium]
MKYFPPLFTVGLIGLGFLLVPAKSNAQLGKTWTKTDKEMYDARTKEADKKRKEAEDAKAREVYQNLPKEIVKEPAKTVVEPTPVTAKEIPARSRDVAGYKWVAAETDQLGLREVEKGELWGLINDDEKEVVCTCYDNLSYFQEGCYAVRKNWLWGFVDRNNNVLVPPRYNSLISQFTNGLATVIMDGRTFEVDKHGVEHAGKFLPFKGENAKWGVKDFLGRIVVQPIYEGTGGLFREHCIDMILNGRLGMIDEKGKVIVPFKYDNVYVYGFNNGLVRLKLYGEDHIVNMAGKVVINYGYDAMDIYYADDRIAVRKGSKWGFINGESDLVIPVMYDRCYGFKNGLCMVKLNDKYGFIDPSG